MPNRHTVLNLAWRACLASCAAGAWGVANATDWVESRTALDCGGINHAGFNVRVMDDNGLPVGATVSVCQSDSWCGRGGRRLTRVVESRDVPPDPAPVAAEGPTHRIDLRLVDTEDEPIRGARVSVPDEPRADDAVTDADGRFLIRTVSVPERLFVSGPWGVVSIGVESAKDSMFLGRRPDVVADLLGQSEIRIPILRRVELEVSGIDPGDLAFSWRLHYAFPWHPVEWALVAHVLDDNSSLLRVDAPGRLPRFGAYPPEGRLVLDFTEERQHALVVVDDDGPVAGATVDLIEVATPYLDWMAVNDPGADIVLASLSTDAAGRVLRLGNPRALYIAYVYADGYQPERVLLEANSELPRWLGYTTRSAYAADAFPLPPAARLRGEPVSFDSIRPGWVELVLDDPAGPARHYLRKAEPGTTLTLVVNDRSSSKPG